MTPTKLKSLTQKLAVQPIIAILRGISPEHSIEIALAIYEENIKVIEVPLTSDSAIKSIELLSKHLPDDCLVGAGTVTSLSQLKQLIALDIDFIVSPNTDKEVISAAIDNGVIPIPGVASPTEAFTAYQAGAKLLKVFPAASYGPMHIEALKTVLPKDCQLIAVGGIKITEMQTWTNAGALALGIGKDLYQTGDSLSVVTNKLAYLTQ
jgi:2-dehydro-3-deoxyphosphogalactonate aldolase